MAAIKARPRADGTTAYTVTWVMGGGAAAPGRPSGSETFNSRERAAAFKLDVEDAGHRWPKGWIKGVGYVAPEPTEAQPTFADAVDGYFDYQERRAKRGIIEERTVHDYRSMVRLHLMPHFGAMEFAAIDLPDIEDWIDAQCENFKPKGVRNQHGLLSAIMKHGSVRMKLRGNNPCTGTTESLPVDSSWEKRQVRFMQKAEWATLRSCLDPEVWLFVDVLLATAMRFGEATALFAGDINFTDDGTAQIHVQRAWKKRVATDREPDRDKFEVAHSKLGLPKSKRTRWVSIQGEVAERLYEHINGMPEDQFVFMTGGRSTKGMGAVPIRHELFAKTHWRPALERAAQLGMARHATPHMLRHTAVVWSIADGVPIEVISEMLGHASIQITYDVYGGLLNMKDPRMAKTMAQALLEVSAQKRLRVVS